jgi:hypothetical protein
MVQKLEANQRILKDAENQQRLNERSAFSPTHSVYSIHELINATEQ